MSARLACKFDDGDIWWRGSNTVWRFKSRDEAERLAAVFEATAAEDWFRDTATTFARQLREATRQHDQHYLEEAA